jgi:hypothetical protein
MNATNKTTKLLTALVVLQGLTLAGIWSNQNFLPQAAAQGVDPGAQRLQQLDELKSINGKLERIAGMLEGGKVQVRVVNDDEGKDAKVK